MNKIIKFKNLTVIDLNIRGHKLNTLFQYKVFSFVCNKKSKTQLNWDSLVNNYINIFGDTYTPRYINISDKSELIIGDPSKISWHYKNKTSEWQHILAPKIRKRYTDVFGQLVVNGMLKIIPNIK